MSSNGRSFSEESLDPFDWDEIRSFGHKMVDDMIDYLSTVRKRPVWRPIPKNVLKALDEPLPLDGQNIKIVYEQFLKYILPYPMGNIHPRFWAWFWAWVVGTGTPLGMLPYEVGCVLVRNRDIHHQTFILQPEYLKDSGDNQVDRPISYRNYGIDLSRNFRALKVWFCMKTYGLAKFGRLIYQNTCQARYLAGLIEHSYYLELLAPAELNIVCFRFKAKELNKEKLNSINRRILLLLRDYGIAFLSGINLNELYSLRCAITNHRSCKRDFEDLVANVVRIGIELADSDKV